MTVKKLVKKAKSGDNDALIQLIMQRQDEFYKLAYVMTENKDDAMDAMQDMIVILHEKIKSLRNDDVFYSWSKTILVNCCRNIYRKNKRVVLNEHAVDNAKETSDPFLESERQSDLYQHLNHLNDQQAEAIKLKYLLDLDINTIAEMTDVSPGTVKSRIFNGLKKLRNRLRRDEEWII